MIFSNRIPQVEIEWALKKTLFFLGIPILSIFLKILRMDPITGVAALTGLTIAALAGIRLKKQLKEGFAILPSIQEIGTITNDRGEILRVDDEGNQVVIPFTKPDDRYAASVKESQTKYNALMSMVNPVMNPLLPGSATKEEVNKKQQELNSALGSLIGPYDPTSPEALRLKDSLNRLTIRSDAKGGLFNAIKFCREAAEKNTKPFTIFKLDQFGNNTDEVDLKGEEQKVNDLETLKFDEICGVCLTSGIDEDGKPFNGRKGMLIDPSTKESATNEKNEFQYPFPRAAPSMGTCEGAPNTPAFAINNETLQQYQKRIDCMKSKEIDDTNGCSLCFENDVYSFVPKKVQRNTISLVLMGVGKCNITADKVPVKNNVILDSKTPVSVPLILNKEPLVFDNNTRTWRKSDVKRILPVNEGESFMIEVTQDPSKPDEIPIIWGYMRSTNPNGGEFAIPLNIVLTRDDVTNSPPNRTGGFHKFPENDVEVSKIRPGGETGREMKLTGEVPFTFVQPGEFSSYDCPSAPYQTQAKSVSRFAADQPCYAKGTGKGKYNDECLRERILAVGCTNGGELYKNPQELNINSQGGPASLTDIYNTLQDIAAGNMLDPDKTRLCSGKVISSPCDYFRQAGSSLKMEKILDGSDKENAKLKPAALKCLTHLYNNQEQPQAPSYLGLNQFANDTREKKALYCLPEGQLNPARSNNAALELARIYDMGFSGSRGTLGVDAVKDYLNSTLQMAVDERRNGNTDPERRAAIRKCFGTNFSPLLPPAIQTTAPRVQNDPPKYIASDATGRQWRLSSDNRIRLNSGTVIEVDLIARPDVPRANEGRVAVFIDGNPEKAIRNSLLTILVASFQPNNADFAWFPIRGSNNTVVLYNNYDGGYVIGYDSGSDSLVLVRVNDSRSVNWKVTPYPSTFVKDAPSLLVSPKPRIAFAWYGTIYNGIGQEVTNLIQNAVNRGDSTFVITNNSMGGDPVPGIQKTLWIDFTPPFGGSIKQFSAREFASFNFSSLVNTLPNVPPSVTPPQASLPATFSPSWRQKLGEAWNNGDYELSMEINPTARNFLDWASIVHFTSTGNQCCAPGDRMPAIWFNINSFRLHIAIGDMRDGNWRVDTSSSCNQFSWNTFSLTCRGSSVQIRLNQEVINLTQPSVRPRGVATVYSNFSHSAAMASIRNFKFTSLN